MAKYSRLLLLIMSAHAFAGCGDDEGSNESPAPDGGTDASDSGGSGGTGGNGGSGGSGGTGGAPLSVRCGSETCETSAAAMGFITACCAVEATSTCGTSIMGNACAVAGESDPRCPALDIMGFIMLPSCCTDENQCGIDAAMFGMPGCVDLATAGEQAQMMGGITLPEPQACTDDTDGGTDDDAGL
jgi:hypothetical protein